MKKLLVCMLSLTLLYGCRTESANPDIGFLLILRLDPNEESNARSVLVRILEANGLTQTSTAKSLDDAVTGHIYTMAEKAVFCSLELEDDGELRFAGVIQTKGEDEGSVRRALDAFQKEYPEATLFFGEWDAYLEYGLQNRLKSWGKTD